MATTQTAISTAINTDMKLSPVNTSTGRNQCAVGRVTARMEEQNTTVGSLRKNGAVGGFTAFIDIQVMCNDRQRQYPFDDLLEEGSCHCGAE